MAALVRMKLIPGNYAFPSSPGKLLFFVGICVIQFYLMIAVGIYGTAASWTYRHCNWA